MTTPTIIHDTSPIFPTCPSFGFISEPQYLVKITPREGGYERRDRKWQTPLTRITAAPSGDQAQADISQLINFWHAMGGMSYAFRFKDYTDYQSCEAGGTPSATDQPLLLSGDSPASYRLVKEYISGTFVQQRYILRPNCTPYTDKNHSYAGIQIANTLGATQTDYTLNESTGLLTKGGSFTGTPGFWGGEFYLWMRFDAQLNPEISNYKVMNVTAQLQELRVPLP
jgi:uncharacterized protein (TIGR02217 family)